MNGTELALRATIDQIESHRNRAIDLYGQAYDVLQEAAKAASCAAPSVADIYRFEEAARDALAPRYSSDPKNRELFVNLMTKQTDRGVWKHLIDAHGIERLMDATAKQELREQLHNDPPPATAENCYTTLSELALNSHKIFLRGIATAFSKLDRRFRSHDGFKIGSRVILSHMLDENGFWNYHRNTRDTLRDIERTFSLLDSKEHPVEAAGVIGAMETARGKGWGAKQFEVDTEYFLIRCFKNGNAHLWMKRDDLVREVNKLLAEHYGEVIPAGSDVAEVDETEVKRTPAKNFGFFPTPEGARDRLFDRAKIEGSHYRGQRILEPNAGTGNLARPLALDHRVTCVEIQPAMAEALRVEGIYERVICGDFHDQRPEALGLFDRIIMNPPFDWQRDVDHVCHALKFLHPDGLLAAIMSAGTEFRENKKGTLFRQLVESRKGTFYDLPAGSFAESGTYVNTIICLIPGANKSWSYL